MNLYEILDSLNIKYEQIEHKAVFTINDSKEEELLHKIDGLGCKNLFLKDSRKKYFLVILHEDKQIKINEIAKIIGATHMSFAKEEELMNYLGLIRGSVSPFGIINDKNNIVTVVLDHELVGKKLLFHPNRNTATLSINYDNLIKFIEHEKHNYIVM